MGANGITALTRPGGSRPKRYGVGDSQEDSMRDTTTIPGDISPYMEDVMKRTDARLERTHKRMELYTPICEGLDAIERTAFDGLAGGDPDAALREILALAQAARRVLFSVVRV